MEKPRAIPLTNRSRRGYLFPRKSGFGEAHWLAVLLNYFSVRLHFYPIILAINKSVQRVQPQLWNLNPRIALCWWWNTVVAEAIITQDERATGPGNKLWQEHCWCILITCPNDPVDGKRIDLKLHPIITCAQKLLHLALQLPPPPGG